MRLTANRLERLQRSLELALDQEWPRLSAVTKHLATLHPTPIPIRTAEAISLPVVATVATDGGEESRCGWLKDKFGLSWQVIPKALGRYLSDPDRQKADRAMQAMMKMRKIVIADLDKAFAG